MTKRISRRQFLKRTGVAATGFLLASKLELESLSEDPSSILSFVAGQALALSVTVVRPDDLLAFRLEFINMTLQPGQHRNSSSPPSFQLS